MRTEEAYVLWHRQFVRFHSLRHPETMGKEEVESFLSHLVVNRKVSASTQNQALNALIFMFREVLKRELCGIDAGRTKTTKHLPVVLSVEEVKALLTAMDGVERLQAGLLYGCGLRLMECLRLRMKEIRSKRVKRLVAEAPKEA